MLRASVLNLGLVRRTSVCMVSAWNVYLKDTVPKLQHLPLKDRFTEASTRFKALPEAEREALQQRAKALTANAPPRKRRSSKKGNKKTNPDGTPKAKRAPSQFAVFVRDNMPSVTHLPKEERMKALAAKYKSEKGAGSPAATPAATPAAAAAAPDAAAAQTPAEPRAV